MKALSMQALAPALLACAGLAVAGDAAAQTVVVRQGNEVGSGTMFRRGGDCLVLTAAHVVPDPSRKASVQDRTGATDEAQTIFRADQPHDVTVLQLSGTSGIDCGERWPDSGWMASERFRPGQEFYFMRQERGGRETAVMLRWAGGSPGTLTLSPADKVGAIASDSGSLVYLGERPAGIVLRIQTDTGRVEVLRMDVIHGLVASNFESGSEGLASLGQVRLKGRDNGIWKSYISTWFGQQDRPALAQPGHPGVACRVAVDVLDMRTTSIRNPEREKAQQKLAACRNNVLTRSVRNLMDVCVSSARAEVDRLPASVNVTTLQMQVNVADAQGSIHQDLQSFQFQYPQDRTVPRSDVELNVLTSAFDGLAPDLLRNAGCMKAASRPAAPPAAPRRSRGER